MSGPHKVVNWQLILKIAVDFCLLMRRTRKDQPESLDNLLEKAFVGSIAWCTFVNLIEHSAHSDFEDMRFCWFITSCTIIADAALGTGYCREEPFCLDNEPSQAAREAYISFRLGKEKDIINANAKKFPQEFGERVRIEIENVADTLIHHGGRKYEWAHSLFGLDPRESVSLRDKFKTIYNADHIQAPLHDLDQAMPYLEELHSLPHVKPFKHLADILVGLGVPYDRLGPVLEIAQSFSLIDPHHTITDTYSGLVIPFTIADNQPFAGKKANVKFARRVEIEHEQAYLRDAACHPVLRVITPRVLACLYGEGTESAALVTLDTKNNDVVAVQDQYAYFTLRERVFQKAGFKSAAGSHPAIIDAYNRALAHASLTSQKNDPAYAVSPFALVHPWEVLEERLLTCKDQGTRRSFQHLRTTYKQVESRVRGYAIDTPTTLIHGDARPENVWDSPLSVRPLGDASHARTGNPEFDVGEMEAASPSVQARLYLRMRNVIEQEINGISYECHVSKAEFAQRSLDISFANAVRHGTWKAGHNYKSAHHTLLAQRYQRLLAL